MEKSRIINGMVLTVCAFVSAGAIFFTATHPAPNMAYAVTAEEKEVNEKIPNPIKAGTIEEIINNVINFFFTLALIICPLIIIAGGFMMVTSGGDPGKVETGKNMVYYALIGLGIVILAKGFVLALKQILKVKEPVTMIPLIPIGGMIMAQFKKLRPVIGGKPDLKKQKI